MHISVAALLIDIESELRRMNLWQSDSPGAAALASVQPFAMDTLTLPQWLQFVFIPRMYVLVESGDALPEKCGIAPMAEEYLRGGTHTAAALIDALERMDQLLSGGKPDYRPLSDQVT